MLRDQTALKVAPRKPSLTLNVIDSQPIDILARARKPSAYSSVRAARPSRLTRRERGCWPEPLAAVALDATARRSDCLTLAIPLSL